MTVTGYVVGILVVLAFGLLAMKGEQIQRWAKARRLRKHLCHTRCDESRRCKCGCRDGMYTSRAGTRCWMCGRQFVQDDEEYDGPWSSGEHVSVRPSVSEVTQENPAPKGFTSWGWERDREFRRARHARQKWEGTEDRDA